MERGGCRKRVRKGQYELANEKNTTDSCYMVRLAVFEPNTLEERRGIAGRVSFVPFPMAPSHLNIVVFDLKQLCTKEKPHGNTMTNMNSNI